MSALENIRAWGLVSYDLISVGHGITEQFVRKLQELGHLPEGEDNDGFILAETALLCIPVLITSDHHLLDIDLDQLRICFTDSDLTPVSVVHPKQLLRALDP